MESASQAAEPLTFQKSIRINAPTSQVWRHLTDPEIMQKWSLPGAALEIRTDWTVGSLLLIRGNMNGEAFENRGTVLQFEPEEHLQYSHLSSISRLPDRPASYVLLDFRLLPLENQTSLTLTLSNFPTQSIYKHLVFYWNGTLESIKRMVEVQR